MNSGILLRAARICSRIFCRSTGALILYLTYGYAVSDDGIEDPLVNIAEEAMQGFARASDPGAYLVDTIPWLKYIPDWFPGAGFQQDARAMRRSREQLYDVPYNFVQKEMVSLLETPSSNFVTHV